MLLMLEEGGAGAPVGVAVEAGPGAVDEVERH